MQLNKAVNKSYTFTAYRETEEGKYVAGSCAPMFYPKNGKPRPATPEEIEGYIEGYNDWKPENPVVPPVYDLSLGKRHINYRF